MRASSGRAHTWSMVRRCANTVLLLALATASVQTLTGVAQEADKRRLAREDFSLFAVPRLVIASN
ncbi:MAG: hypothetical protein WBN79_11215, partial [Gemmatimonadota bacterium]